VSRQAERNVRRVAPKAATLAWRSFNFVTSLK